MTCHHCSKNIDVDYAIHYWKVPTKKPLKSENSMQRPSETYIARGLMKYKTLMRIKKSSYLCLQKPEQSYKLFKLFLEVKERLPEDFQNQEEQHRSKELTWNHKTSNMKSLTCSRTINNSNLFITTWPLTSSTPHSGCRLSVANKSRSNRKTQQWYSLATNNTGAWWNSTVLTDNSF